MLGFGAKSGRSNIGDRFLRWYVALEPAEIYTPVVPSWYLPLTRRRPNGIPSTVTGAQYNLSPAYELNAGAERIYSGTAAGESDSSFFFLRPPHLEIYSAMLYRLVVR